MPTDPFPRGSRAASAPGALLLCRADPESVAPLAPLLGERMVLTRAGERWSVLVPEGGPWEAAAGGGEPVDRVVAGWAVALAVGSAWPVLALWWDADRAGFTLASGFRRPVGYVWLANGTPAGEDEAMRTFAARLGLDPVLDMQSLERLTAADSEADARARLRGLIAVLTRAGVELPDGLTPGVSAERLSSAVAGVAGGVRPAEGAGWREAVRAEFEPGEGGRLGAWLPGSGDPRARWLGLAQVATGVPAMAWGVWRRRGGWVAAGVLLLAHGALGLAYEGVRGRGWGMRGGTA
ncbi:hypothetical protein [Streptomyces sp. Ag109_G2-15]|uniref:hypothetical protein n=1 Tax=Streptomyces sp. Ag109_G2-15 TaxID=1938850 RepID=UPI000BDC3486|nr:hypothetical protein [Streptomyces sp. Ag109_G2-15]SOD83815.1 hypothetical protein SAMN06272765_1185 [Streptomyces sp. Ag109_G2-15]